VGTPLVSKGGFDTLAPDAGTLFSEEVAALQLRSSE